MPDTRPVSSVDAFLAANNFLPTTPVQQVVQQPQQPQQQRQPTQEAPEGIVGTNNFLRPEDRRSWTVPAGVSQFSADCNPFPDRTSAHERRLQRAQLAAEVERQSRLSGSSTVSNPRAAVAEQYEPHLVRGAGGLLRVDWTKVGSDLPHDPAGRPYATTDVDRGGFQPGADFF